MTAATIESKSTKPSAPKKISMASRCGLTFPTARVGRFLRSKYSKRVSRDATVMMTGVLEYLTVEILDMAGTCAKENKVKRIVPRHITLVVRNDEEFNAFTRHKYINGGGFVPRLHKRLVPPKRAKKQTSITEDAGHHETQVEQRESAEQTDDEKTNDTNDTTDEVDIVDVSTGDGGQKKKKKKKKKHASEGTD